MRQVDVTGRLLSSRDLRGLLPSEKGTTYKDFKDFCLENRQHITLNVLCMPDSCLIGDGGVSQVDFAGGLYRLPTRDCKTPHFKSDM